MCKPAVDFTTPFAYNRHMNKQHGIDTRKWYGVKNPSQFKISKTAVTKQTQSEYIRKIAEEVSDSIKKRKRLFPKGSVKNIKLADETWLQQFSDLHYGLLVKPVEVGELSIYNASIAKDRIEYLAKMMTRILQYHTNKPKTLVITLLGDMIDNCIMRGNQGMNIEFGVTKQVMEVTEILTDYIIFLSKYFHTIKCYGIYGNHGRITRKTTDAAPYDNFDNLVYWSVKERIKDMKDISMEYTDAQHMIVEVNGWKFWLEHGDTVNSWVGIPFYGAKREKANITETLMQFRENADYMLMGHHHQAATFNNIFLNGSFVGGDIYSIGKLRRMSLPSQNLMAINKKHGVVWNREIQLIDEPRKMKIKIYK